LALDHCVSEGGRSKVKGGRSKVKGSRSRVKGVDFDLDGMDFSRLRDLIPCVLCGKLA
jgi:ubiquitin